MRVTFVYPPCQPTDGGVYPFVKCVTDALKAIETQHIFSFQELGSPIEADFSWFLTPHWQQVNSPFAMTVWDLGHRVLPEFPEVSLSGWNFAQREAFYSHVLPRAAIVVTGNEAGLRQIRQFYNIAEQRIICNPLPLPSTFDGIESAVEGGNWSQPYLLYPAQFWPHKNHVMIIDAVKLLRELGHNYNVVFTGSNKGNLGYVQEYAKDVPGVTFAGFVSVPQLKHLYEHAYAMVYASLLGPDNLPPLEALSLGCPLICYDYPGARQQLGGMGRYFSTANELADHIIHMGPTWKTPLPTGAHYALKIVKALNKFASIRKLWGSYTHT